MGFAAPSLPLETRRLVTSLGKKPHLSPLDKSILDQSPAEAAKRTAQEEFASILSQSVAAKSGSKPTKDMTTAELDTQARQAAEDFVAVAFVQPIFKNLRNSHIGGELPPPFGPGPGEKQFRSLADTQVAKQLVHASNWPLVDSLTKKLRSAKAASAYTREGLAIAPAQPGSPADLARHKAAREAKLTAPANAPTTKEATK